MCHDDGRVLVVRASATTRIPGTWSLPGGGLRHGEHPAAAVVREIAEETGLTVKITGVLSVAADVVRLPGDDEEVHHDRVVFEVVADDPTALRPEPTGTSDLGAWLTVEELTGRPMLGFAARALGVRAAEATSAPSSGAAPARPEPADGQPRVQRFAAYGLTTDPSGRILLTRIAPTYPGAGRWHLPGGGTDFGEQPDEALRREVYEETAQHGRVVELLGITNRHNRAAQGPEGYPIDWHTVRALYRVAVDSPGSPRVTEAAGGSTADAAWFAPAEVAELDLTDIASHVLARYLRQV